MNALFKALNDTTRREILELLKKKDLTAGEIADQYVGGVAGRAADIEEWATRSAGDIAALLRESGHGDAAAVTAWLAAEFPPPTVRPAP